MAEEKELYVVSSQLQTFAGKLAELRKTAVGCCDALERRAAKLNGIFDGRGGIALQKNFQRKTEQCRACMERLDDYAEKLREIAAEYEEAEKESRNGAEGICNSLPGDGETVR